MFKKFLPLQKLPVKLLPFFVIYLLSAGFWGWICRFIYQQNLELLLNGSSVLTVLLLIAAGIIAVMVTSGFLILLTPSFKLIVAIMGLAGIVAFLMAGVNILFFFLGAFYWVMSGLYAFFVRQKIANQIKVSLEPFKDLQQFLFWIFTLFISVSMSLGYHDAAVQGSFVVPPSYKTSTLSFLQSQLESTFTKKDFFEAQNVIVNKATQRAEKIWNDVEAQLTSYPGYISIGIGSLLFVLLKITITFFAWIPFMVFTGCTLLLRKLKIIHTVTKSREVEGLEV